MAIPFSADSDYLPPGPHEASIDEIKEVLVTEFADSSTRSEIFEQWLTLRAAMSGIIGIRAQWLNGSFATKKPSPGDLDLATIVDGIELEGLTQASEAQLGSLTRGPETEDFPLCDSYLFAVYPDDHPMHGLASATLEAVRTHFFGQDDRTGVIKGFVEVVG